MVERFPDKKEAHGPIPCAPTGMTLCEIPDELPVQLKGDPHFYCPLKLGNGIKIGWGDPRFVVCSDLEKCRALRASRRTRLVMEIQTIKHDFLRLQREYR